MKYSILPGLFLLAVITTQAQQRNMLFDNDWYFYRGEVANGQNLTLAMDAWRRVDLPHDWSIEDLPGTDSPFDPEAVSGVSGGFTVGGTGWYRKQFSLSSAQQGKRVYLQFDGVYMNATVWLNGDSLGIHPYGYTSFYYDITDKIKATGENTLAVRVSNEGRNSRWYSGSGIYRHVWLKTADPLHVGQWGSFITTTEAGEASARVNVKTTVLNKTGKKAAARLLTTIKDPFGKTVATLQSRESIPAGGSFEFNQDIVIAAPALWSLSSPALYTAYTEVLNGKEQTDMYTTTFGIRTISFDARNGFQLNGRTLKLKGGCVHHDNGPLGARAYDRAEERKIQLLKAAGYNAIRTAHNPPSPALLDACDRLGMLVIDEAFDMWSDRKNKQDYHLYFNEWWQRDLESMIRRDRNHPSVIMWSTGNEIPKRDEPQVVAVAQKLADYIRTLDTTRPVTCGVNGIEENKDPFLATLDVAGYNYARDKYESEEKRHPDRVVYAAESFANEAFEYWQEVLKHPYIIGDFVWTAFDHIGEASIGWLGYKQSKAFYPWNLAFVGDIDICGWKRPQSYYRDALWKKDQLAIFVKPPVPSFPDTNPAPESWSKWNWDDAVADWNWKGYEDSLLEVTAYSSCEQTELFLNGRSLGKKKTDTSTRYRAVWRLPYRAGELKAVGYTGGKEVAISVLRTAAVAERINLSADAKVINADNQDLSYITVELTDANGLLNPKADNELRFTIEGPGTIVGVGNANPKSTESYQQPQRRAWRGKCLVIVKAGKEPGMITLKATADGLQPAELKIEVKQGRVPEYIMQKVYEEVKTPYKYGLVMAPQNDSVKMDCPTVFRRNNNWYMSYIVFNGRGYETWLAESKDLLNWNTLGRMMSFSADTTQWDSQQKAGYMALEDYTWGGSYRIRRYKRKHWMSYFGGSARGYEAGDLSLGIAYTKKDITRPHEWKRLPQPILTAKDKDVRWWENRKLFKSTIIWDRAKTTGHPFVMYYNANGDSAANNIKTRWYERIGMAVSDDMVHWKRYLEEPVVHHPMGITGDAVIQKMGNLWVMFYFGAFWEGRKDAFNRFACSYDLVHWTDWDGADLIGSSTDYDSRFAHKSFVVKHNGVVYHFYNAVNAKDQRGIAVATSRDLGKSKTGFPE